ncbi:MAG: ORF6N domain-containing protein [Bdellovibrionales bacterium]|nr:ORF6N domain-containing protein [Bdellovibrionales bacterium]
MTSKILKQIDNFIYNIRDQKVMLDEDLSQLYEVDTRSLVQAVKRNTDRFPEDFMFQLSNQEVGALRSQFVISKSQGGRRTKPYAFTEQGIAMLSSVLRSKKAVLVNIEIMRAFVRLRKMISSNEELARQVNDLEKKYDSQFKVVFEAIREIMNPSKIPIKRKIGFGRNKD